MDRRQFSASLASMMAFSSMAAPASAKADAKLLGTIRLGVGPNRFAIEVGQGKSEKIAYIRIKGGKTWDFQIALDENPDKVAKQILKTQKGYFKANNTDGMIDFMFDNITAEGGVFRWKDNQGDEGSGAVDPTAQAGALGAFLLLVIVLFICGIILVMLCKIGDCTRMMQKYEGRIW